jgi:hypothetical protein
MEPFPLMKTWHPNNSSESFHRTRAGSGSVMANGWFRIERERERERKKRRLATHYLELPKSSLALLAME